MNIKKCIRWTIYSIIAALCLTGSYHAIELKKSVTVDGIVKSKHYYTSGKQSVDNYVIVFSTGPDTKDVTVHYYQSDWENINKGQHVELVVTKGELEGNGGKEFLCIIAMSITLTFLIMGSVGGIIHLWSTYLTDKENEE